MRAAFLLLLVLLLPGCAQPAPEVNFGCAPVAGTETIAARRYILIDGGAEAADAAAAIACLAAEQRRVIVAAGPDFAGDLAARLNPIRARGGAVQVFTLDTPPAAAASARSREERDRLSGEARNDAFARAAAEARDAADAIILVLAAPDGARDAVGLSGHTWRPLGARVPANESYCLRAEASARPGLRVRLTPFEDVPTRGAAIRYDGLIEVGPAAQ